MDSMCTTTKRVPWQSSNGKMDLNQFWFPGTSFHWRGEGKWQWSCDFISHSHGDFQSHCLLSFWDGEAAGTRAGWMLAKPPA